MEFCRRKRVVLAFLHCVSSKFAAVSKINIYSHFGHALSDSSYIEIKYVARTYLA